LHSPTSSIDNDPEAEALVDALSTFASLGSSTSSWHEVATGEEVPLGFRSSSSTFLDWTFEVFVVVVGEVGGGRLSNNLSRTCTSSFIFFLWELRFSVSTLAVEHQE